ncbi:hypothetical protein Pfo_027151 [Paulownia fortunei]|nr:hypothetical protein Pfo_027151 [Paulownia fortunei]
MNIVFFYFALQRKENGLSFCFSVFAKSPPCALQASSNSTRQITEKQRFQIPFSILNNLIGLRSIIPSRFIRKHIVN